MCIIERDLIIFFTEKKFGRIISGKNFNFDKKVVCRHLSYHFYDIPRAYPRRIQWEFHTGIPV